MDTTTPWSGWEDDESDSKDRVREQLSEMRAREDASDGQTPKRKRGRPRKNETKSHENKKRAKRKSRARQDSTDSTEDDEDLVLDDDDAEEEEADEVEEPEEDPNDPEFEPNRRTSRRNRKPVKTYNTKLLLREEMSKARESFSKSGRGRGRGRPRGSGRKTCVDLTFLEDPRRTRVTDENEFDRLLDEEVAMYEKHLPTLPPVIPDPSQRLYVVRVDSVEALTNAGAGFRLMTSCVTDDMMVSLFHLATDKYFVNTNAEDVVQLAQVLRHVWNQLPLYTRLAWEDAAHKAALKNHTDREEEESAGEEGVHVRKEVMPVREFPFGLDPMLSKSWRAQAFNGPAVSDMVRKQRPILSSCCSIRETWRSFIDVQSHLLAAHYTAMFYACHFCGVLHQSVEALLTHVDCSRWTSMLLNRMVKGGDKQKVEMKVAYLFMVCTDCGLWLPIRVNYPPDRLPKAWCFFATVMENHSCKKLVPLVVYMAEAVDVPSRDARLVVHFVPSFLKNFPVSCEECQINAFSSPDEMDHHFQNVHHTRFKCTKCGECSGTEMFHRAHLASHLSDSLLLADYLRTSCTFYPPPFCDGPPVVGANGETPACGGCTSTITPSPMGHDLLDHCEPLVKTKLINALTLAKSAVSDDDDDDEDTKRRADMGFENFDYSELEFSPDEKEAKNLINEFFHKVNGTSEPDDDVLDWSIRVNDYKKVVELLSPERKLGVNFAAPRTVLGSDNFADLLVTKFTKRISLPISACMELLSGNLLLKRFMYCTACNSILASPSGLDTHNNTKCGTESLVSLFCPPAPVNSELECPTCSKSVCSISGFRAHMAIQHGIYVEYKTGTQLGMTPESNASLQDIAARYPDTRTAVARDTDNALWLRYGILQPRSHFEMQLNLAKRGIKVIGMDPKENGTPNQSTPRGGLRPIMARRSAFTLNDSPSPPGLMRRDDSPAFTSASALAQGINQHYIKPFVLVNNMLRCKFCAHQTCTQTMMRDHLQSNHVLVCRACGNGFAHREALTRHGKLGRCSMQFKDVSVKQISADCGVCYKRMSLANAYLHLFREHLNAVLYGTVSGQVYPEHLNLHVDQSLAEVLPVKEVAPITPLPAPSEHSERRNREVVVYKVPPNADCTCYLCGMQMANADQLNNHLSRHPEKWTKCPFCIDYTPIADHEAMRVHLTQRHMDKKDGNLCCRYCQRIIAGESCAHLLYMCTQTRKCALCYGNQVMKNSAEMTVHWTNKHLDILRRFQCSDCGMTFCHVKDFWSHQCRSHFMQQKCSCGFSVTFSSRTAFLLHFGMHIDEANMTCKLCKFKFSSKVALQNHRLSHAIMVNSATGRQLIILDPKLAQAEQQLQQQQQQQQEAKKPRRSAKELDALIEEKRFTADITLTVRSIVRQVCESLGEVYNQKDSPSPSDVLVANNDDDIIELDSPGVDDDLVDSAEATANAHRASLMAQVRVEVADNVGNVGSSMPGYVEDDDENAVECLPENVKAEYGSAVVKEVHDDNNDDDLQVIGEVEHAPGVTSSAVVTREKKYKCSRCSSMFITAHAAKLHEETSHSTDAGGICEKVFGIPLKGFFFVCRNCCAAFESQQQFKNHRLCHGPTGSVSCGECSAIAYNTPLFEHHRNAHATKDRLFYGCSQCSMMFRTDARLMFHLREAHGVPLFFFCKACHLGGTHEKSIYVHVALKSQRCRQFGQQKNWTNLMTIGVCPANVLHYQPKSPVTHEMMISRGSVEVVVPSECSHRSFLAPTDSLITCRECFCTMTAASFTAAEAYRNGGVSKELAMTLDNGLDFPFTSVFEPTPSETMQTLQGRAIAPRIDPAASYFGNGLRSTDPPRLAPRPIVSSARVATVAPLNRALPVLKRRSVQSSNSDVITLGDEEPGPSAAKRAPLPVQRSRFHDPTVAKCKVCEAPMPSAQIMSLHELHKNGMKWFCLDCASAQMDEVEAMKHYFTVHVKVAEQKCVERGQLFRPLHYELQCPFPKCREPLSTLTNLRIHINNKHRAETAYSSSACMFRFCSPFAKAKHDGQHSSYESVNGVEGTCCPLCGTLNQWNIQMPGSTYTMSHIAVHGLRRYHMCRDCFVCFKGDYDCIRMRTHFETTHCTVIPKTNNRELLCKLCREVVLKSHLTEHVIEKHLVTGFKSRDPKWQGKLIVKTGAVTRRFLGFDRIYHVGDDSDMD
ncbi:unnamed protein product [Cylicocyclus nassatus]|uniref:C2H2-type domain-containing protein n=1 Tax=Cylicocyclus nassatus TaxID=53992 RepID=A0AA36M3V4_CYLNA|nr:unnamed protein product [Cylicocyclus nassatus]